MGLRVLFLASFACVAHTVREEDGAQDTGPAHNGVFGDQSAWLGGSAGSSDIHYGERFEDVFYMGPSQMYKTGCKEAPVSGARKRYCLGTAMAEACGHDKREVCKWLTHSSVCHGDPSQLSAICLYCLAIANDGSTAKIADKVKSEQPNLADQCSEFYEAQYNQALRVDSNASKFFEQNPLWAAACDDESHFNCAGKNPVECGYCDRAVTGDKQAAPWQDCEFANGIAKHMGFFSTTVPWGGGYYGQQHCLDLQHEVDGTKTDAADFHAGVLRCWGYRAAVMKEVDRAYDPWNMAGWNKAAMRLLYWSCTRP